MHGCPRGEPLYFPLFFLSSVFCLAFANASLALPSSSLAPSFCLFFSVPPSYQPSLSLATWTSFSLACLLSLPLRAPLPPLVLFIALSLSIVETPYPRRGSFVPLILRARSVTELHELDEFPTSPRRVPVPPAKDRPVLRFTRSRESFSERVIKRRVTEQRKEGARASSSLLPSFSRLSFFWTFPLFS